MVQYRIVKQKHANTLYKVQQKKYGFWWDTFWRNKSLDSCEWFVQDNIETDKLIQDNPRDIIIKTY